MSEVLPWTKIKRTGYNSILCVCQKMFVAAGSDYFLVMEPIQNVQWYFTCWLRPLDPANYDDF